MQWRPSDAAPNCQPPASLDGSRGGRGGPPLHELMRTRRCSASATGEALLKHVNVLGRSHFFEHLWPNRNAHLAHMDLLDQGHVTSRLTDASTDAQRKMLVSDPAMIRQPEEVELAGERQLLLQRLRVDAHPHR